MLRYIRQLIPYVISKYKTNLLYTSGTIDIFRPGYLAMNVVTCILYLITSVIAKHQRTDDLFILSF